MYKLQAQINRSRWFIVVKGHFYHECGSARWFVSDVVICRSPLPVILVIQLFLKAYI